ncbi:MAG TPA: hypothetical protein PLB78_15020, partial [Anaerolineae bacterium]|nr:hypothetical protein [Anaerolineae bacterium]
SIATAMQAINAIPALCAAPPGIATMADLPLVRSGLGFGFAPVPRPAARESKRPARRVIRRVRPASGYLAPLPRRRYVVVST